MDIEIKKDFSKQGCSYKLQTKMDKGENLKNLVIIGEQYLEGKTKELKLKLQKDASAISITAFTLLTSQGMSMVTDNPAILAAVIPSSVIALMSGKNLADKIDEKIETYNTNLKQQNTIDALSNNLLDNYAEEKLPTKEIGKYKFNIYNALDKGKKLQKKFKLCKKINITLGIITTAALFPATIQLINDANFNNYLIEALLIATNYHFAYEAVTDAETQKDLDTQNNTFKKIFTSNQNDSINKIIN